MQAPSATPSPASILITGASSGLGEALARHYACTGARLAISGRDAARLNAVADACRTQGASVDAALTDVTDRAAMAAWIAHVDAAAALDLVIANAGVAAGTGRSGESEEAARRIFAVNLDGVLNTAHPAVACMRLRRRGRIALMSSLAALRGLPTAPAYSASKAAVKTFGDGLRGALARDGIGITVICPGFVVSRMTAANRFRMPFLMPAERAAQIIADGLARNRAQIAFPLPMVAACRLLSVLPSGMTDRLLTRLAAD